MKSFKRQRKKHSTELAAWSSIRKATGLDRSRLIASHTDTHWVWIRPLTTAEAVHRSVAGGGEETVHVPHGTDPQCFVDEIGESWSGDIDSDGNVFWGWTESGLTFKVRFVESDLGAVCTS